jgi:TrmH family RNA methyltransferase
MVVPFQEQAIPENLDLAVAIDAVTDPGNLGTILRTAWAVGVDAVFLTKGCVDPYNPKVIRAAVGAHFRLPIFQSTHEKVLDKMSGLKSWLAATGEGLAYSDVDWRLPSGLIIGSEAHGVGDKLRSMVKNRVQIPLHKDVESLNAAVAAGIILFEIRRQREAE